ncbi:VanZ family protein [Paenibacillus aestuarii]|uniref:VanZ family protein n=1 Tax=Paenibacillus aestuarii TaxID=516965 RepID=A0ABW0KDA2_9BACL|nr:VanZ family protein [Paenibacillus aestuarii]
MAAKSFRKWIWLLFAGYTACLLYWMFLGFGRHHQANGPFMYNLIPLKTLGIYIFHIHTFSWRTWVINIFGNIGVFMPYGWLLPCLFCGAGRYWRFALYFGCPLVLLEMLQMLLRVGSMDIDDVILNGLGASISYGVYRFYISHKKQNITAQDRGV